MANNSRSVLLCKSTHLNILTCNLTPRETWQINVSEVPENRNQFQWSPDLTQERLRPSNTGIWFRISFPEMQIARIYCLDSPYRQTTFDGLKRHSERCQVPSRRRAWRWQFYGILCRVVSLKLTDVSEVLTAFITRSIALIMKAADCRLVVVMGWDCRLRTAAVGLLFYPRVTAMWRRDRLGLTPNLTTKPLWVSPETSLERVGDGRRKWEFNLSFRVLLHAVKSYDMGHPALIPTQKEGVLRIFIALTNPSPWPGSKPQHLGPVARTLTTIPHI
jgi:hypothetical protein